MTRAEAETRAAELAAEDPDHGFFVREHDGDWEIVRVPSAAPGQHPLRATTEAQERPPQADDPRPTVVRVAPPYG